MKGNLKMKNLRKHITKRISFALIILLALSLVFSSCGLHISVKDDTAQSDKATDTAELPAPPATESETEPATESESQTETAAETAKAPEPKPEVTVITVKDYKKDVIPTEMSKSIGWDPTGFYHHIAIPAITSDTANAKAFNDKLYSVCGDFLQVLESNTEDNLIINRTYQFKKTLHLIAIIVTATEGVQCGGIGAMFYGYYYDTDADREITFDEYLSKLGLQKSTVLDAISKTEDYKNIVDFAGSISLVPEKLLCGAFDGLGSIAVYQDDVTMNGVSIFDFGAIVYLK